MSTVAQPSPPRRPWLAPALFALFFVVFPLLIFAFLYVLYLTNFTTKNFNWNYDAMSFGGSASDVHVVKIEGKLPANLEVEVANTLRYPESIREVNHNTKRPVRFRVNSITLDSVVALSGYPEPKANPSDPEKLTVLIGERCYVRFKKRRFHSLFAGGVKLRNTLSNQVVELPAEWQDIERVFGKPIRKSSSRTTLPFH